MKYLYHYCSNQTLYQILRSSSLRMSDISKSNDYKELNLFFPGIFRSIMKLYKENVFPFSYRNMKDEEAVSELLTQSYKIWNEKFESGDFLNYVACFSEKEDSLNQWRSYADNGRGCCIGFSKADIESYCKASNGVIRLEKVNYISDDELKQKVDEHAEEILGKLKIFGASEEKGDNILSYSFNSIIENIFINSLTYKSDAFEEEREWRIFLSNGAYREKELVISGENNKQITGSDGFSETIQFLKDRIEIVASENDFITYCPLLFSEFCENPVKEIWIGPKNIARKADVQFLIDTLDYGTCRIYFSKISYF